MSLEKFKELLEKEEDIINPSSEILSIIESSSECREYYNDLLKAYFGVEAVYSNMIDSIANDIMYNSERSNLLSDDEIKIREELQSEFTEISDLLLIENTSNKIGSTDSEGSIEVPKGPVKIFYIWKKAGAAAALLLLAASILFIYSNSQSYSEISKVFNISDYNNGYSALRSQGANGIEKGIILLEHGDYLKAANVFDKEIVENPENQTNFYIYYLKGIAYYKASGNKVLFIQFNYDSSLLQKALSSFNQSIKENQLGRFDNILLNAYFFAGNIELLLGNKTAAIEYLSKVVNEKGSFSDEAGKLLILAK